jgi:DNA mismatch endonuclease Vsr
MMPTDTLAPGQDASRINFIDLFAGVGGFTLGFRGIALDGRYSFVPRLLVDSDDAARKVVIRNLTDVPYLVADIHTLSGADIRRKAGIERDDRVHVLLGGPPCQGFSFLGKRMLNDERNLLVVDYIRIIKELRPLVAIMENVPLMITNHGGQVIQEVCSSLSAMGYASCAHILSANEYGVPQIRKRAFVIAYSSELGVAPELPSRTHERISAASDLFAASKRIQFEPNKLPYVSVDEAIGDLPSLLAGEGSEVAPYPRPPASLYQRSMRSGSIAVFNHRSRAHSKAFLAKIAVIGEGGRNHDLPDELRFSDNYYSQAYARLDRHGLANTITTFFGNPGSGRFTHYRDLRSISVREAARLQSFPDSFVFDGDLTTQMRHVGNAVPPLLARAIRNRVAEDLATYFETTKTNAIPIKTQTGRDTEERSRVMRAVPSKNSQAELMLRKSLSAAGMRGYRLHSSSLPGCPDVVFTSAKLAVFVDGCFWHGCPRCYREPKSNKAYWQMKVQRNKDRDARVTAECRKSGWRVLRLWEHDILRNADRAAAKVIKAISRKCASTTTSRSPR